MLGPWLSKNMVAPLLQSLAGAALVAGGLYVGRTASEAFGGCPADLRPRIVQGERALERGDIDVAGRIAEDSLVESPTSSCANSLAAAVWERRMRAYLAARATAEAEAARVSCFTYATHAAPWGNASARIEALKEECRAPSGFDAQVQDNGSAGRGL